MCRKKRNGWLSLLLYATVLGEIHKGRSWMATEKKMRFTLTLQKDVYDYFEIMAREEGVGIDVLLVRGLGLMKLFHEKRKIGFTHLGFTKDPKNLDLEVV